MASPGPSGSSLCRWAVGLGLALLVIIPLVWIAADVARQPRLPAPLLLPTGETVVLRGITYGTNHIAPGTPVWMRILPPAARRWAAGHFIRTAALFQDQITSEPRLMLWLEVQSGSATNLPPGVRPQTWLMLADETGQAAGERRDFFLSGTPTYGMTTAFGLVPWRSKAAKITWIQGSYDERSVVGQWEIPVPQHHASPPWSPESLPAVRQDGDLECTLKRVVFGAGTHVSFIAIPEGKIVESALTKPGEEVHALLSASFRQGNKPAPVWTVGRLTASDAAGNLAPAASMSWPSSGKTVSFSWSPVPWPAETWELRISAKRTSEADFAPGELLEFKDLSIPGPDIPVRLANEAKSAGVTLNLTEFILHAPLRMEGSWSTQDGSHLKVKATGLTNEVYVDLVKLVDEQGKSYKPNGWSGSSGNGYFDYEYYFSSLPTTTRSVSVTFAVHRGRTFTFRVRPEVATDKISLPGE